MQDFLFQYYPVHPTTWVYLSSLLLIGVFFKFGRFWSVRNVDLILLILLAPGLLTVHFGEVRAHEEEVSRQNAAAEADASEGDAAAAEAAVEVDPNAGAEVSRVAPPQDSAEVPPTAIGEIAVIPGSPPPRETTAPDAADPSDNPDSRMRGRAIMLVGYLWLLGVLAVLLLRLLLDPTMVRRPLLEPNLSTGGLAFIGCSLFVFLMANVVNSPVAEEDLSGPRSAEQLLSGVADQEVAGDLRRHGPGNALLHSIPSLVTTPLHWQETPRMEVRYGRTTKVMAILSHLAVVIGTVVIGYQHFGNMKTGIGAATLYLMLPYTSMMTGRVGHVLPAALLVWAIVCYRRPLLAGGFIGLAGGAAYYPFFLLPLWLSFYWQRGLMRFLAGVLTTVLICVLSLLFVTQGVGDFVAHVQKMFAIWIPEFDSSNLLGVWNLGWDPTWRVPVFAAFIAIVGSFCIWPAQKNLGTLLSCSAAIMVASQFWHGYGGGLYMAWFLPLTLLTVFRPNLEDRVALSVLGEGWLRRKPQLRRVDRAA